MAKVKTENPSSKSMHQRKKAYYWIIMMSLIPGLSQFYLNYKKKAFSLFIIDAGILITFILADSYVMKLIMINIYIVTFLPAAIESYQIARYQKNTIDTSAKWYVTLLLLTTGFSALPLLWQSGNFSKKGKIIWSIAIPVLAVAFFFLLAKYWDRIESIIENFVS